MGRPESSEWDLHNHKIMYEEAMERRQKHIEMEEARKKSQGLKGETPTKTGEKRKLSEPAGPNNFDMHEDELRDFLMNRIAELRSAEQTDLDEFNAGKFKFKASTISNVLPSGHVQEQSRLEANYKNRFRNKGEKLHKKLINKQ